MREQSSSVFPFSLAWVLSCSVCCAKIERHDSYIARQPSAHIRNYSYIEVKLSARTEALSDHFPIFLSTRGAQRIVLAGSWRSGPLAKLRLLLKTQARDSVFGPRTPRPEITALRPDAKTV